MALLAAAIAIFYAKSRSGEKSIINDINEKDPRINVHIGNAQTFIVDPVREKLKYNDDGFVDDRPLPEVNFMPATERSNFEITNAEDLPYVKYLPGPPMQDRRERAMGARFKNFYNFEVSKWWDDGSEDGVFSGVIEPNGFTATNTYTTHTFIFKRHSNNEVLERIVMEDTNHLYFIGPAKDDTLTLNSQRYQDSLKEVEYMKSYHKEHGVPWLSNYPRGPPELFHYPTDFVGQKHHIKSNIGYFKNAKEQSKEPVDFNITVVATTPKILLIQNLLSDYEIKHIISMGEKVVKRSKVGSAKHGFSSKTRTSENGWLKRSGSKLLNTVYYRFADVLGMTDQQLIDDGSGAAENLQFVRYLETQRYDAHHDFGYTGKTQQRFSTLLIYLEVPEEGGGTSFPKAFNGQGIQVKPARGDAVLFYSMLEDGNGDDMSLHSGMPVTKGRKYVCNLWSWDPKII